MEEGGIAIDFSELREALSSQSYSKVADICDSLMLRVAAEGVPYQDEWPYALHLLGYLYVDDINSARFLWKSIPAAIKESQPELAAAWKVGQKLWTRDYAGVHEAVRGFDWSQETQGLVNSFLGVGARAIVEIPLWVGMPGRMWLEKTCNDDVYLSLVPIGIDGVSCPTPEELHLHVDLGACLDAFVLTWMIYADVLQQGWLVDPVSLMLTVKKPPVLKEQKLNPDKLQRLTEYVFQLEH
ncbi:hypothetical protein CDL15_Pgr027722 [Punica granatum]|uniref:CSN8/PSMD8/EIF3K domain-containing protein n=2 Tax=Punica granatum TaxID=22663 RepID=A0A218XI99_PUNGR|nr:hypothetical protein CDL15_Pgr027722 [Punica granatum]